MKNKKVIWIIVIIIILVTIAIWYILEDTKTLSTSKLEYELIKQGKSKSSNEVFREILKILTENKQEELNNYLSDDFIYYNDDKKFNSINKFYEEIESYNGTYKYEQRVDETYCIYWNAPKGTEINDYVTEATQKIFITLKKVTLEDEITYQIEQIILKKNK